MQTILWILDTFSKELSIQLQKMFQLDAENVWENLHWEIKGYFQVIMV